MPPTQDEVAALALIALAVGLAVAYWRGAR